MNILQFPMHEWGPGAPSSLFALLCPKRLSLSTVMQTKVLALLRNDLESISFPGPSIFFLSPISLFKKCAQLRNHSGNKEKTSDICNSPGETTARNSVLWSLVIPPTPILHYGMHEVTHQKTWALSGPRRWLGWKSTWITSKRTWLHIPSTLSKAITMHT